MKIAFLVYRLQKDRMFTTEFYRQDIEILQSLGHEVVCATRLREVPKDADMVFLWWWNWLWLVGPFLKARGFPICVTGSLEPDIYEKKPLYYRLLVRWGLRFADRSAFVSQYMIRRLSEMIGLEDPRYCPHIVLDDYRLRNQENHRSDPNVIFNVAWKKERNMRRKMLPELIEAFSIVLQQIPTARLVLAGEPMDGQAILIARAKELGIGDAIDCLGKIDMKEKIKRMQNCGVYYQCSRHEGFGLAIAEAMACGAPVVVNNKTAIPEVVGPCGYYVKDESVESIADTLIYALNNQEDSQKLGREAAHRIDKVFRFNRRKEFFGNLFDEMGLGNLKTPERGSSLSAPSRHKPAA